MATTEVIYLTPPTAFARQESLYLLIRDREGWIFSDDYLTVLPNVSSSDPHAGLWRWRAASLDRLLKYLKKQTAGRTIRLLDVGCGNGWMSNRLQLALSAEVWAVDVNKTELEQGARVFSRPGLKFVFADIMQPVLPEQYFDVAVLAGSAQYFPDFSVLVNAMKRVLKPGGEVHIIDTNFYRDEPGRAAAREGTMRYYAEMGVPEMAEYFFHHLYEETGGVDLNDKLGVRIRQRLMLLSPFPWIRVRSM
jgi:SAM-dependent methyltransferase